MKSFSWSVWESVLISAVPREAMVGHFNTALTQLLHSLLFVSAIVPAEAPLLALCERVTCHEVTMTPASPGSKVLGWGIDSRLGK